MSVINITDSIDELWLSKASGEQMTNLNTKYDISCAFVLVLAIIGVICNTMTLVAFQYARIRKKYRFHKTWNHSTVFIWNLALVDVLSASNMSALYIMFVFCPEAINTFSVCILIITTRDIFILISATSLTCIAITTVLGVTKNEVLKDFCDNSLNVTLLIIGVWILGFVGYIAKLTVIYSMMGDYNVDETFDCGTFYYRTNLSKPTLYSEFFLHLLALFIIFVSYCTIMIYVAGITNIVDRQRDGNRPRNSPSTKVACLICGTYILQCTPYMICRLFFKESLRVGFFIQFSAVQRIPYMIYYTQFLPNTIIYVTRNKSYRNAYVYWIKNMCYVIRNCCRKGERTDMNLQRAHRQDRNRFPLN